MPTVEMLWTTLLSLVLIAAIALVALAGIIFIVGVIRGYQQSQGQAKQNPHSVPSKEFVKPFAEPSWLAGGPMLGEQADENPNEFCPVCHYHWSVCANVHTLHHEPVPASVTKGTMRSIQE